MTVETRADDRTVTLCVLLWARPGRESDLVAYEDEVLPLLDDHAGRLVQRVRARPGHRDGDEPYEVQIIEFADDTSFEGYLGDDRRAALADRRDAAIARTQVVRVDRA